MDSMKYRIQFVLKRNRYCVFLKKKMDDGEGDIPIIPNSEKGEAQWHSPLSGQTATNPRNTPKHQV
ncbi:MAG: hypothetical protein CR994_03590 [Maribacter sp.]|nr:MAG: hypothetical protein CR994_03590 [Maribacter sp.]